MTRVTETFAGSREYPSPNIACYLRYKCAYCERKFFMVSPITFLAGGAIMHEKINRRETGLAYGACLECINEMKFKECNSRFLI
jgi:hypothetical protein